METRANYTAVGAFVLLCMVGIVVALLWLAGHQYRQAYAYYQTYFYGSVTGLGTGTVVRYNGIDVGRVTNLDFDRNNPRLVVGTLEVRADLTIHQDATASIESQGLTGAAYVEITGGAATSPPLAAKPDQEYPVINSKPSPVEQLLANTPALLAKLGEIADRLADILSDQNRAAIADTLTNLRDTTAVFARHSADLDQIVGSLATASKQLDLTLSDVRGVLAKAGGATDALGKTLGSADLAAAHVAQLTEDLDGIIKGSSAELKQASGEGMTQLTSLIGELRPLVANLDRLSKDLEHHPTSLLFGDRREGYSPK
jgi:phospholipid/cholesterol/gamma-HCH transport system substrate-binding protein